MDGVGINLRAYLSNAHMEEELRRLISHLADSAKYIAFQIEESVRGALETKNIHGEPQMKLDVLADNIIMKRLLDETTFGVREMASEELDRVCDFEEKKGHSGRYSVTIDPLDGSSLIDVNLSIGTIFGIHDGRILDEVSARERMPAAMYFLYGPTTTLVLAVDEKTHEFHLDHVGNWVLKTENIQMEDKGEIYSPGGLRKDWLDRHRRYIEDLEKRGYKLRYSGALVADINQVLMKRGGVFTYPASKKDPNGKLRLLFELQPMALIMENAGGRVTNGLENILDIIPEKLDQRSPIYAGSRYEVDMARGYLKQD